MLGEAEVPVRGRMADDPHRPLYHFTAPTFWLNDPNGLIYWRGAYHLFYQYNPSGALWGNIHWGHAISRDLVHWEDRPIALAPSPGTVDADGCWSGVAVVHEGTPHILYTGWNLPVQLPCLAVADSDALDGWVKYPGNPVIPAPPADLDVLAFRDHTIWREDGSWLQAIGSGIRGKGGAALLYRSPDLVSWEYLGPLCVGVEAETGDIWECPEFFALHDRRVLVISSLPARRVLYCTGRYARHRFAPGPWRPLDLSRYLYAPQSMIDDRGNRLLWGWIVEGRADAALERAGWAGAITLPRVLTLLPDGDLGIEPVRELEALRGARRTIGATPVVESPFQELRGLAGDCIELSMELDTGSAVECGLTVRRTPDGAEETRIVYNPREATLRVDRARASLDPEAHTDEQGGPLRLAEGEPLRLRVFLDRSVLEIFANGRACLTDRIYPSRPDSLGLGLFAAGGTATLRSLVCWEMRSIWPA